MAAYFLIRTTPDGVEKTEGPLKNLAAVARSAGMVLYYNARVPKADAQRFGAAFSRGDLGETVEHESGYRFRIEKMS